MKAICMCITYLYKLLSKRKKMEYYNGNEIVYLDNITNITYILPKNTINLLAYVYLQDIRTKYNSNKISIRTYALLKCQLNSILSTFLKSGEYTKVIKFFEFVFGRENFIDYLSDFIV